MVEVRLRAYELTPQAVEKAVYFHELILNQVRERNVVGARQAMEDHLVWSLEVMQRARGESAT
jgi:DNA-binding GntR family transcriptional regulator